MPAQRKFPARRKSARNLVPAAAAVLSLMAVAACGGPQAATSRAPASHQDAADPASAPRAASGQASPAKPTSSPATSSSPGKGTTSSPSSSPAGQRAGGHGKACVTSADKGACGPYNDPAVSGGSEPSVVQDIWNPINGASQTLTSSGPGDWSVSADMPASNTAVVSYPDIQTLYTTTSDTPDPLTNFGSITGSYTESGPAGAGVDWEAAYDIWAGAGTRNYAQEIMIWVDNHGQTPAGSKVGSATIDGVGYTIWSTGKAGAVSNPVSIVMNSNQASGSVNVLDDLNWLESNGYVPAGSGLNQIDFGWEICSTGGSPQTFTMSQYRLKASRQLPTVAWPTR
ncbi:MAG: GH12 family glycosyl hydrolase domain-containing protein [Trebonia sp.]